MTSQGAGPAPSAFNLRWGWQDFAAIYVKENYGQVPLMELQCPYCGRGTPFTPANGKIVNDKWQGDFEIIDHATHTPHGPAFDLDEEIHERAYGHVTLRCLSCSNAFYVMFAMKRGEYKEGQQPTLQFWKRLTVPNTAALDHREQLEKVETELYKVTRERDALKRLRNNLIGALGFLLFWGVLLWSAGWYNR